MKKTLHLFLLLAGLYPAAFAQVLSPAQLQSDFELFRRALREAHPAPYRYTPEAVFAHKLDSVQALLNQPMTVQAFYVAMTPLVTALRDGHIKWMAAGKEEKYPFHASGLFPLDLYFVGDKAWVEGTYGPTQIQLGAEVVSVNGVPAATLIGKLLPLLTFSDGSTVNGKYEDLNRYFSGLYATYVGTSDAYEVVYRTGAGEGRAVLPAVTQDSIHAYEEKRKPAPAKPVRMQFLGDETALLSIDRFQIDKAEQDYPAFLKESFRQLKAKGTKHLVIDLRNNEGGKDLFGTLLYSYLAKEPFRYYDKILVRQKKKFSFPAWTPKIYNLARVLMVHKTRNGYEFKSRQRLKTWKPQRDAFGGDVYVLTNGNSFSVTTEFASVLHHHKRATFIGQETGGGYYGDNSGAFAAVRLPHSNLELGIPLLAYYSAVQGYPYPDRGILPDHPVVPTIDEILRGHDRALQTALDLIGRQGGPAASN
jgi:hypothetical protein